MVISNGYGYNGHVRNRKGLEEARIQSSKDAFKDVFMCEVVMEIVALRGAPGEIHQR